MKISVAICTWNNADMLKDLLNSLKIALTYTLCDVEIIVVNNNSTDATDDVITSMKCAIPIRCVFEPNPGLSNARNTAVKSVTGDFIVWTDDDVIVQPNWLHEYERAFDSYPNASFFGGPIAPKFDHSPPKWLISAWDSICHMYAIRDLGIEPFQIEDPKLLPFGANFAVRTRAQKLFRYDPTLGRQPSALTLCGEETKVLTSMLSEGHLGYWVPTACVKHRLTKKRMTIRHLVNYSIGMGRTLVKVQPKTNCSGKIFSRTTISNVRKFLRFFKRAVVYRINRDPNDWVPAIKRASILAGKLYESIK